MWSRIGGRHERLLAHGERSSCILWVWAICVVTQFRGTVSSPAINIASLDCTTRLNMSCHAMAQLFIIGSAQHLSHTAQHSMMGSPTRAGAVAYMRGL